MLLDPTLTVAYVIVAAALAVSPGPDVMFVVATGMTHHTRGAIAAALGIGTGSIVHAIAAALGVSAVIAASPVAFDMLRLAGAAYLAFLGIRSFRNSWKKSSATHGTATHGPATHGTVTQGPVQITEVSALDIFARGLITNILNPKVVVFYLALLPQFVNVALGNIGLQIFLLGCIHNIIGLAFLVAVGLAAGKASGWLAATQLGRWMDGIAGIFFLGLAVRLAISGRPEK